MICKLQTRNERAAKGRQEREESRVMVRQPDEDADSDAESIHYSDAESDGVR